VNTNLKAKRFPDIVLSENRWQSEDDRGHRIHVSTESSFGPPTPSGVPSSRRSVVTTPSQPAGPRSPSGSETSWSPMQASSSTSRSPAPLYVTSAEAPRIGNDADLRRPSVGQQESDAIQRTHNWSPKAGQLHRRRFAPRGLCTPTGCGKPWTASKQPQECIPSTASHKPLENRQTAAGFPQRAQGLHRFPLSTTTPTARRSEPGLEQGSTTELSSLRSDGVITMSGIGDHDPGTSDHVQRNTP
jgi:hypothetical protein